MKLRLIIAILIGLMLVACDKVGSQAWCDKLERKSTDNWTVDELKDHTKYCVLGLEPDKWCKKMQKKPKGEWTVDEASKYTKNCVLGRSEDGGGQE